VCGVLFIMCSRDLNNLSLRFSSINVNSMNVSTLGSRNAKTYIKIEGVTGKKADVIFLCDVRANNKGADLEKLFRMTQWKLLFISKFDKKCKGGGYSNTTGDSTRGEKCY
jgi:hypothetical protein